MVTAALVLGQVVQLYAIFRLFVPDPSANSGYPAGVPLSVRVFQWAVWGDPNGSPVMTLLPIALLAWMASSRRAWTPVVPRRVRTVALAAALVFTTLSALKPVAVVSWLAVGDSTQMTYGLPTDNILVFAFNAGVFSSVWAAVMAAVMSWTLYAARPEQVDTASPALDAAPADTVPDDPDPDPVLPAGPAPARAPHPELLSSEAQDLANFRRPSREPYPAHPEADPNALFRRPG